MSVEMKLELGHRAVMRDQPTPEGFTHDWMVFVKGAEGSDIQHFVDKVVFYLHESFPKPKRVVKEPPYQVAESGYAGFIMPIEVYFRNKEEPKKVRFEYDLFLRIESSPVYNIRREKLTFQNPSDDFRRKLLKARGVGSGTAISGGTPSLQTQTTAPIQHVDEPVRPLTTHTKPTPSIAEKKPKSHSTIKEPIKTPPPPPPPPPPAPVTKASQQFTDIFGSVIKTKPSPDLSSKNKEISHSSHPKQNKSLQPPSGPVGNVASKEPKSASKVGHSPEGKETKSKLVKSEKEPKSSSLKRPLPPDGQNHPGAIEKKKKYHSNSDTGEKHTDGGKTKDTKEKKEKHRSKTSGHVGKKEKHKTSSHHATNKDHISKSPKAVNNVKPSSPDRLSNDDSNDAKSSIKQEEENVNSPADYLVDATSTWCEISPGDMDDAVERDLISPLSPDIKHSPAPVPEKLRRSSNHDTEDSMDEKPIKPVKVEKSPKPKNISKTRKSASQVNSNNNNNSSSSSVHRSSKQNGSMKENHLSPSESKVAKAGKVALDPAYVKELVDLQKKIMALEDRSLLQRVVEVIEETGRFQMTNKSFDFDLCSLDQSTVRKLKHCLAS